MARVRTLHHTRSSKKAKVKYSALEAFQAFTARRIVDVMAGLFFVSGIFMLLALLSYNQEDPSWNTANAGTGLQNWAGLPGAWAADFLLQTIGAAGFIMAFGLIFWGLRIFARQSLRPFSARMAALMTATLLGALALAQIPSSDGFITPYWGGSGGTMMMNVLGAAGPVLFSSRNALAVLSSIAAGLLFAFACGVRKGEIILALAVSKTLLFNGAVLIFKISASFYGWLRRYNDPDYSAPHVSWLKMPDLPKSQPKPTRAKILSQETISSDGVLEPAAPDNPQHIPVVTHSAGHISPHHTQQRFPLEGDWQFPALDLLQDIPTHIQERAVDESALRKNAQILQNVLADYSIQGDIASIHPGPVVTLYELEPAPGIKTSRVISLSDDIARSMSAVSVRAAVVPGRNVIGIELPNKERQVVYMRDLLASKNYEKTGAHLPLILGKDIGGKPVMADLAKMPHLLVAGTTGSGKSVGVNSMILSLLFRLPPEKCRLIMIDPKMLELSVYDDIPHLLCPVVTEPGKAIVALKWAVQEMEERYRAMSKLGVRNIEGYNARMSEARKKGEVLMHKVQTGYDAETGKPVYEEEPLDLSELPYIVIIVDEFADLMLVAGKDVEAAIQRLAQMARAAGLHLIMATQRPSVDVITGVIKANFPTRISFQVTSKIDSRTILGEGGAEQLLGMGDMLYMAPGGRITRVHGPYVSDEDVENVVNYLKAQGEPNYIGGITDENNLDASEVMDALFSGRSSGGDSVDELYDQAVSLVARERKASTSFIQRYLQIGYNRAARIIEEMERQGVISKASPTGKREILVGDHSSGEA